MLARFQAIGATLGGKRDHWTQSVVLGHLAAMRWFFGNVLAGFIRFIVAWFLWNWVAVVSALAAIGAAGWAWASNYDHLQITLATLATFVLIMWTAIGFVSIIRLSDKEKYDWALAYQGLTLGLDRGNADATLQIGVNLLNVASGAVTYRVEELRVVLEDRTIAAPKYDNEGGTIPRHIGRVYRFPSFKKSSIEDYLGKRTYGTVEFSIVYGPHQSTPIRRLKMKLNVSLRLDDEHGIVDTIVSELDSII